MGSSVMTRNPQLVPFLNFVRAKRNEFELTETSLCAERAFRKRHKIDDMFVPLLIKCDNKNHRLTPCKAGVWLIGRFCSSEDISLILLKTSADKLTLIDRLQKIEALQTPKGGGAER